MSRPDEWIIIELAPERIKDARARLGLDRGLEQPQLDLEENR
jgi:hypothetical protein